MLDRRLPLGMGGLLMLWYGIVQGWPGCRPNEAGAPPDSTMGEHRISVLAVGDVNLGRSVGQEILAGDTLFPFRFVRDTLISHDLVFGNLESPLSEQGGETQDPENNLIFTGPPAGAWALRRAGFTIVSTANNHALDYGMEGLTQTVQYLSAAGVRSVGTSVDGAALYAPEIIERQGIRIGFFACTAIMNITSTGWRRHVAVADTAQLLPAIRAWRDSVDLIVVSYHGGGEYLDRVPAQTKRIAHEVLGNGAGLFLGHHPHVPYGIELVNKGYAVYSLGNFVFRQHGPTWTGMSYALTFIVTKDSAGTRISDVRLLPVQCGVQPRFDNSGAVAAAVRERVALQSTHDRTQRSSW